LKTDGIEITLMRKLCGKLAKIAFEVNDQVENIGARRLHTIITTLLEEILFDAPDGNEETFN